MFSDDTDGQKPYRTYKARGARRTPLDDELAGARPAKQPPPRAVQSRETARSNGRGTEPLPDKGYRRYGANGAAGRASGDSRGGVYDDGRGAAYDRRGDGSYGDWDSTYDDGRGGVESGAPGRSRPDAGRAATAAPKRRRIRWWTVPVVLLILVIIAGVVATVLAWPGYKQFDRAVGHANNRLGTKVRAQLSPDKGWIVRSGTTILLLGVDSKAGEPARSDTVMLMRFDPSEHKINQLSIPRDTRVEIPGRGYDKINAAMFWGGPSLAVKTVERYTGIPINHVMVVNFQGFPRLVNAVGGVDMYVPKTISTEIGGRGRIVTFEKGMHHFDGKYGMAYVRIRKADDDFHRARRQQQFLQALQKKLMQPSNITKLPLIGKRFMSGVATDLTTNQILVLSYLKWRADGGSHQVMVGEPAYIGGVAYVLPPDDAKKARLIRRFLD